MEVNVEAIKCKLWEIQTKILALQIYELFLLEMTRKIY